MDWIEEYVDDFHKSFIQELIDKQGKTEEEAKSCSKNTKIRHIKMIRESGCSTAEEWEESLKIENNSQAVFQSYTANSTFEKMEGKK